MTFHTGFASLVLGGGGPEGITFVDPQIPGAACVQPFGVGAGGFGVGFCPPSHPKCVGLSVLGGCGGSCCKGAVTPTGIVPGNGGTGLPGQSSICTDPGAMAALRAMDPVAASIAENACTLAAGQGQANGGSSCRPCGKNECNIPYVVKSGACAGQTRQRKGRLVTNPATGEAMCVPKSRRMNPMNAQANRRSMSRLKGAHREAKKIIDTLDGFAKPKRSRRKCA